MTSVLTNIKLQQILQPDYGAKLAAPASISRVADTCYDVRPQALDTAPKRKTAKGLKSGLEVRTYTVYNEQENVWPLTHQRTDGRQKITGDLEDETTDFRRKPQLQLKYSNDVGTKQKRQDRQVKHNDMLCPCCGGGKKYWCVCVCVCVRVCVCQYS
jgi:hypothetical protein